MEEDIIIPYSRIYWQEVNSAVGPEIAIAKILVGLKIGHLVWDCHTYNICG